MTWQAVDEAAGLWSAAYKVPGFLCRSSALRLPSGEYLILSPGAKLLEGFEESHGRAAILMAPNSFHHMGLAPWQVAFPEARRVARGAAHSRLEKQGVLGLGALDEVESALPEHVSLIKVPHTRIGETWLRVQGADGVTWCVGDSFFNLPSLSPKRKQRIIQKVLRAAPGPAHSNLMKWGGLKSRKGFKSFVLEQLDADQPKKVVPLHGDVIVDDATEVIRALVERRL